MSGRPPRKPTAKRAGAPKKKRAAAKSRDVDTQPPPRIPCPDCDRDYANVATLERHRARDHADTPPALALVAPINPSSPPGGDASSSGDPDASPQDPDDGKDGGPGPLRLGVELSLAETGDATGDLKLAWLIATIRALADAADNLRWSDPAAVTRVSRELAARMADLTAHTAGQDEGSGDWTDNIGA